MRVSLICGLALFLLTEVVSGGDLLPADRAIEDVVDREIDAQLLKEKIKPAAQADDATIVRRLTLDLVGRIPTQAETREYVDSTDPAKRVKLVERLLNSPGFARHQADSFDAMIMAGGGRESMRDYLAQALREGRPWDRQFREIMAGDESKPETKGSSGFLKSRIKDLDRMTSDVSSVFFGVNVSCAKCHDHPLVHDWKQDHYYGMKSFLSRTIEFGAFVGETDYGTVKFKTVSGAERQAKFMFLTGKVVEVSGGAEPTREQRQELKRRSDEAKKKKTPPPAPSVSARAKLADVALQEGERDYFARSIANRLFARFFGRGLVMPLDQMHSENPSSHPELLAWLARDTISHNYDLKRLIRGLVMSHAYSRSSRWESSTSAPLARMFAVGAVRPLTPQQLATSMWVATTDPNSLPADPGLDPKDSKLEPLADRARGLASAIARPGEEYAIGVSEALLMSNSDRLQDVLAESGDRLVGRLVKIKDRGEQVDLAVRNVLGRAPDAEERKLLADYLAKFEGRGAEGCRRLVWALLSDSEFRFNY